MYISFILKISDHLYIPDGQKSLLFNVELYAFPKMFLWHAYRNMGCSTIFLPCRLLQSFNHVTTVSCGYISGSWIEPASPSPSAPPPACALLLSNKYTLKKTKENHCILCPSSTTSIFLHYYTVFMNIVFQSWAIFH